jgi:cellulose synthase/poly-beta-1,6-N-acetylglucosamine synthase-like glycosyltransferase
MQIIGLLIIFVGTINLIRLTFFIIGSDIYSYKASLNKKSRRIYSYPTISVVIPARNEEETVLRAVKSIVRNTYPRRKKQIIVVDDGSTDNTASLVSKYKRIYRVNNLEIIKQPQSGKAHALNNGMRNFATGELVMCLDSDSYLAKDGLRNVVKYFTDPKVVAVSANVKIIPGKGLLNLIQQAEYIICYQMKRAQTVFNIEYIIGGIGSTFRKSVLEKIGYYDGNTVTEDIDLTMKLLQLGNKNVRVIYGSDTIAYTESVISIKNLINQRIRWKWGRCQTFLKNLNLFFNTEKGFSKGLTFFYLPYAIFCDLVFFLEPIFIAFLAYIIIRYADLATLISTIFIMSSYIALNAVLESTLPQNEKIKFALLSPIMYFFFYLLSFVEYIALIVTFLRLPYLKQSIDENICSWQHVERAVKKQVF